MDPTPLLPEIREVKEGVENHLPSLFEVCQQIGDERAARGKQYELAALLMLLVLAKLAGMKSLLGASDWMQDQGAWLREHLHLSWKRMRVLPPMWQANRKRPRNSSNSGVR